MKRFIVLIMLASAYTLAVGQSSGNISTQIVYVLPDSLIHHWWQGGEADKINGSTKVWSGDSLVGWAGATWSYGELTAENLKKKEDFLKEPYEPRETTRTFEDELVHMGLTTTDPNPQ